MPVPVPRTSRYSVHKSQDFSRLKPSVFQQLTHTLPATPAGPPPSFGTREEWINSLPSWRKLKPRRIWDDAAVVGEGRNEQDFPEGLTGAGNASVIKGAHAQACIPPLFTLYNSSLASSCCDVRRYSDADADDEMSSGYSVMDQGVYDNESQWSASSPAGEHDEMEMVDEADYAVAVEERPGWHRDDGAVFEEHAYEKGAFSPVYEDDSPQMVDGPDADSSPVGPTTPFGDFVDRAVCAAEPYSAHSSIAEMESEYQCKERIATYSQYSHDQEDLQASEPMPKAVSSPASDYQKLVGPLSEWVSTFVWKVCTTGMSLPSEFAHQTYVFCSKNTRNGALLTSNNSSSPIGQYSAVPPAYLAVSVHSLFQSTLLQPSAILLSLWYIVRLPVYFDAVGFGPEHVKELRFRVELLGDTRGGADRETMEMNAPFRLILLGCMLANKWLDDHTFSNKTWQSISNVPITSLNRLESLALDIFSHDLSTPPRAWSQWLSHLSSYHQSLSSPVRSQPISRPSSNPHSIVRKALEEIAQAPIGIDQSIPEPVFIGLEYRRMERQGLEDTALEGVDVLEIDLDEDGPLRQEYMPKRRVSRAGSINSAAFKEGLEQRSQDWEKRERMPEPERILPPPAKWSPAADEPIFRDRGRISGEYVALAHIDASKLTFFSI
ncbi:hypothetical protein HWV62_36185 [Athelia sp. TMB]|nr:hypothetical protein HWV62_36185 [Athelia sp. TMB]